MDEHKDRDEKADDLGQPWCFIDYFVMVPSSDFAEFQVRHRKSAEWNAKIVFY